ncbi:MAG TPA: ABC transporter ATP-binding protein [Ktedonobacterales bacterium]
MSQPQSTDPAAVVPSDAAITAGAGTDTIVAATDVCKTYRAHGVDVPALQDITLRVARGEMVAVMGPSGCGKTTLLNCLAGLDTVDCGTVAIDGVDLAALSDARRTDFRARTMGFIFQSFNLIPVLSAVENVELPLLVLGRRAGEARRRARELLEAVGLAHREKYRPAELSGGQRQRVAIARALINDPAIVWGDEPTGNLDSEAAGDVMALLAELNHTRDQTFVLVTHAADIAARCDRTITMRDGRIVSAL